MSASLAAQVAHLAAAGLGVWFAACAVLFAHVGFGLADTRGQVMKGFGLGAVAVACGVASLLLLVGA